MTKAFSTGILMVLPLLAGCGGCGTAGDEPGADADVMVDDLGLDDGAAEWPEPFCAEDIVHGEVFRAGSSSAVNGLWSVALAGGTDLVVVDTLSSADGTPGVEVWLVDRTSGMATLAGMEPGVSVQGVVGNGTDASVALWRVADGSFGVFRTELGETGWAGSGEPFEQRLVGRDESTDQLLELRENVEARTLHLAHVERGIGSAPVEAMLEGDVGESEAFGADGSRRTAHARSEAGWHAVALHSNETRTGRVAIVNRELERIESSFPFVADSLPPRGALVPMGVDSLALAVEVADGTQVFEVTQDGLSPLGLLPPRYPLVSATGGADGAVFLTSVVSADGTIVDPEGISSDGQIMASRYTAGVGQVTPFQPILSGRCRSAALAVPAAPAGGWVLATDCPRDLSAVQTTRFCVSAGEL